MMLKVKYQPAAMKAAPCYKNIIKMLMINIWLCWSECSLISLTFHSYIIDSFFTSSYKLVMGEEISFSYLLLYILL